MNGINLTLGQALSQGYNTSSAFATVTDITSAVSDVDDAVSTLVADGASPTQEHVTALSDAWDVLKPLLTVVASDASLTYDPTVVNTLNKFSAILAAAKQAAQRAGLR